MSKNTWRVKPTEIARTVKSVQSTGLLNRNIEIDVDGVIRVNIGAVDQESGNETSEDLAKLL